ncbi:MAG: hypothetical protein ACI9TH_003513, partial [Kiritimatiellia bacterium]
QVIQDAYFRFPDKMLGDMTPDKSRSARDQNFHTAEIPVGIRVGGIKEQGEGRDMESEYNDCGL